MRIYHYDENGKRTGYSEQTTFMENLMGFFFGIALGILILVLVIAYWPAPH